MPKESPEKAKKGRSAAEILADLKARAKALHEAQKGNDDA